MASQQRRLLQGETLSISRMTAEQRRLFQAPFAGWKLFHIAPTPFRTAMKRGEFAIVAEPHALAGPMLETQEGGGGAGLDHPAVPLPPRFGTAISFRFECGQSGYGFTTRRLIVRSAGANDRVTPGWPR